MKTKSAARILHDDLRFVETLHRDRLFKEGAEDRNFNRCRWRDINFQGRREWRKTDLLFIRGLAKEGKRQDILVFVPKIRPGIRNHLIQHHKFACFEWKVVWVNERTRSNSSSIRQQSDARISSVKQSKTGQIEMHARRCHNH